MLRVRIRWDMRLTDREVLKAIYRTAQPISQAEIANHLRCSERTVQRSVMRLQKMGYLTVLGGGNRFGPYRYNINIQVLPDDIRANLGD